MCRQSNATQKIELPTRRKAPSSLNVTYKKPKISSSLMIEPLTEKHSLKQLTLWYKLILKCAQETIDKKDSGEVKGLGRKLKASLYILNTLLERMIDIIQEPPTPGKSMNNGYVCVYNNSSANHSNNPQIIGWMHYTKVETAVKLNYFGIAPPFGLGVGGYFFQNIMAKQNSEILQIEIREPFKLAAGFYLHQLKKIFLSVEEIPYDDKNTAENSESSDDEIPPEATTPNVSSKIFASHPKQFQVSVEQQICPQYENHENHENHENIEKQPETKELLRNQILFLLGVVTQHEDESTITTTAANAIISNENYQHWNNIYFPKPIRKKIKELEKKQHEQSMSTPQQLPSTQSPE